MFRPLGISLVVALAALPAAAQVTFPKPPAEYSVTLRYRIRATGEQRIVPFEALAKHLAGLGFKHADEEKFKLELLDPAAEFATGTVPAAAVEKLLDDPNVKTVVFAPAGGQQLDDPKKVVPVRIEIARGLPAVEQQLLHGQVVEQLTKIGFTHSTGYDHRKYTRVRGSLPAGRVPALLKDLRAVPGGWFVGGADRFAQPLPFRNVLPIRTVEVLPDLPAAAAPPAPADGGKLTPALKAVVDDPMAAEQPLVVEAVMEKDTSDEPAAVRRALRAALTGISVDGLSGTVVTLRLPKAAFATRVAELPEVRHVRLPPLGTETTFPADGKPVDVVAASRLSELHALGYDGKGVVVAVVASEFPGLKVTEGKKPDISTPPPPPEVELAGTRLPTGSRLIDLTTELRPTLDPAPADPARGPAGTAAALAVHTAAPKATVLLVRVDPAHFHQVLTVAKVVAGEGTLSPALFTRGDELSVRSAQLESRRKTVADEVERAFSDLSDDPKPAQRRADASAALKQLQADIAAHNVLLERYLALQGAVGRLPAATVVVNTLVWETGHPHDGESELSLLIERKFATGLKSSGIQASRQPPAPAWVQAGGVSVGSVWSGAFRDADVNGLMEFTPPKQDLSANRWTGELAFLAYLSGAEKPAPLLKGLKVRITVQWREPHRPDLILPVEPTHAFRLRLVRQLDPTGQAVASDELVEVAASHGGAVRLTKTPSSGVYEVTLSATLPETGVYALRVEGGPARTSLPPSASLDAELYPRVVLELTDPTQANQGRVVFAEVAVQRSGVGVPGDSPAALAVGVGNAKGPTSSTGVGPGIPLGTKPELFTEGRIAWQGGGAAGTGVAAGYLGGAAACLSQAGVRPTDLVKTVGLTPGAVFVLPEGWLRSLSPK